MWTDEGSDDTSFWHPTPRRRHPTRIWGILAAIALLLCLWAGIAWAHDSKDPRLNDWTMQQTNQNDGSCCDGNDVFVLSDSEWRISGDHYEVLHNGEWLEVPPWALIKRGEDSPTHSALLWVWHGRAQCFKSGQLY